MAPNSSSNSASNSVPFRRFSAVLKHPSGKRQRLSPSKAYPFVGKPIKSHELTPDDEFTFTPSAPVARDATTEAIEAAYERMERKRAFAGESKLPTCYSFSSETRSPLLDRMRRQGKSVNSVETPVTNPFRE